MSNSITLSAQTLPEVYIGYGTEHPDRLFARILNGDEDTPTIEISWARVFDDARRAAAHLVSVAKIEQRVAGSDDLVTVGLLASSSYTFHVYEVACFLLGWTVSTFITHPILALMIFASAGYAFRKESFHRT